MDIYDAISARQTIRDFSSRQISEETILRILEAGLKAPTNDHLRRWEFILVQDPDKRLELVKNLRAPETTRGATNIVDRWGLTEPSQRECYIDAIPKQHSMLLNAGVLILPCFYSPGNLLKPESLSSLNCLVSIWCCIENMLLAAASEGIFGVTRIPFENERKGFGRILKIPAGYEVPCYLALGYPAEGASRIRQFGVSLQEKIHTNGW